MGKFLKWLIVLAIIIGGGLYYVYSSLDTIVATLIEQTGSGLTGTDVDVDGVTITLADGKAEVHGLSIANPKGFSGADAMQIASAAVALDIDNISTETIVIKEIAIDAPKVLYELGAGGSNIDTIKQAMGSSDSGGKNLGPKIIIDNLYIRNGEVSLRAPGGLAASADLDDIHLKNIGRGSNGANAEEIGRVVLSAVISGVGKAVQTVDPSVLGDMLSAASIEAAAGGATDAIGGAVSGSGADIEEAASGAGRAIRGIFGE